MLFVLHAPEKLADPIDQSTTRSTRTSNRRKCLSMSSRPLSLSARPLLHSSATPARRYLPRPARQRRGLRTSCARPILRQPISGHTSTTTRTVRHPNGTLLCLSRRGHLTGGQKRHASALAVATEENKNHEDIGPIQEYDRRVEAGLIRNDEHQRG